MEDYKSEQSPLKMLKGLKECFFGKVPGPQSPALSKDKLHHKYFSTDLFLRATAYQGKLLRKEHEFWNAMYIMLLKVYSSWFSAAASCPFNWPMIDLLRNKDKSHIWIASAFKCNQ